MGATSRRLIVVLVLAAVSAAAGCQTLSGWGQGVRRQFENAAEGIKEDLSVMDDDYDGLDAFGPEAAEEMRAARAAKREPSTLTLPSPINSKGRSFPSAGPVCIRFKTSLVISTPSFPKSSRRCAWVACSLTWLSSSSSSLFRSSSTSHSPCSPRTSLEAP